MWRQTSPSAGIIAVGILLSLSSLSSCSEDRAAAPTPKGGVHPAGIADPGSEASHGKLLRQKRWSPMLDGADNDACGRCHDGTPARPAGITLPAPGATPCTTCHTESTPGLPAVLACGTCHTPTGAHAAHTEPSPSRATGLACTACHPTPPAEVIGGLHGNGTVEVTFDPAVVTPEASHDRARGVCSVTCHDRGGARPRPLWSDTTPMVCRDCHSSPPPAHPPGPCATCHREANAMGNALARGPLHLNGRVDLGDGNATCGACHGSGSDPWPTTAAHAMHRSPTLTTPIACANCHPVPTDVGSPGHLDGVVQIAFSGRARDRGALPTWDADGKACSAVACHGARLNDAPTVLAPKWTDTSGSAKACGSCHGIPPLQHTASTSCDRSTCHGAEVTRSTTGVLSISAAGKAVHINGALDAVR